MLKAWTAGLLVTAALAAPVWAQNGVQGGARAAAKAPYPSIELPERARGQRAIDLLGGRLPEVAAWYGKSPSEFAAILRRDRNAWLDRQGRMFYQEDLDAPLNADAPLGAASLTGTDSALTGSNGVASMKSSRTKASGTFTFAVTGISLTGYVYEPARNQETQDSASR